MANTLKDCDSCRTLLPIRSAVLTCAKVKEDKFSPVELTGETIPASPFLNLRVKRSQIKSKWLI